MLKQYRVRDYDFKLIILVMALTIIGIFAVGSADSSCRKHRWPDLFSVCFLWLSFHF